MSKKVLNNTDSMAFDTYQFQITSGNAVMLSGLVKYAQMLDFVTEADDAEQLNIDGLINSILAEGMTRRIKDLIKRHNFESMDDFLDSMTYAKTGADVAEVVKQKERDYYQKTHDEILSHIPIEDDQKSLPL
jgi:uncharacterized radical SAM superfamily Fe-S cluster-containing enzyme